MDNNNKPSLLSHLYELLFIYKKNVFLTGGAGVGKTYLVNQLIDYCIKFNKFAIVTASTGVAANLIEGMTLHRLFKFGISNSMKELLAWDREQIRNLCKSKGCSEQDAKYIIMQGMVNNIKYRDFLIIDEVSMMSSNLLEMVYFRLNQLNINIPILFVGDFYQLPPVAKDNNPQYAFESQEWDAVPIELTTIKRTNNQEFAHIQSLIRKGIKNQEVIDYLRNLEQNPYKENSLHLFATNKEIDSYNLNKLKELPTPGMKSAIKYNTSLYTEKDIQKFLSELLINEVFYFKKGARVLFLTNERSLEGDFLWYNGEQGTIKDISKESQSLIVTKDNGEEVEVQRHTFQKFELKQGEMKVVCELQQFPLRLAYGISIHKSQGLSLPSGHIECNKFFLPEQFFVAISRFTDPTKLSISNFDPKLIQTSPKIQNFYKNNPSTINESDFRSFTLPKDSKPTQCSDDTPPSFKDAICEIKESVNDSYDDLDDIPF